MMMIHRAWTGSPPRVRGTDSAITPLSNRVRITPACAGNSSSGTQAPASRQDHPRVCGEQVHYGFRHNHIKGSPPRVRGTGRLLWRWGRVLEDHPRVCGEQRTLGARDSTGKGSPPRVRGTDYLETHVIEGIGITPACAGNSSRQDILRLAIEDHPRVCGEQHKWPTCGPYAPGSPPRVRGTDCGPSPATGSGRITPACAGNSGTKSSNHQPF